MVMQWWCYGDAMVVQQWLDILLRVDTTRGRKALPLGNSSWGNKISKDKMDAAQSCRDTKINRNTNGNKKARHQITSRHNENRENWIIVFICRCLNLVLLCEPKQDI